LYHIQQDLAKNQKDLAAHQKELDQARAKQEDAENSLKEKKKEQAKIHKENALLERRIRNAKEDVENKRLNHIKVKEEIQHIQKRLASSESSLAKINKEYEDHQQLIEKLQVQLRDITRTSEEFEAQVRAKKGKEITLAEDQLTEYNRRFFCFTALLLSSLSSLFNPLCFVCFLQKQKGTSLLCFCQAATTPRSTHATAAAGQGAIRNLGSQNQRASTPKRPTHRSLQATRRTQSQNVRVCF
jgi:DNA repair exonuclease SbcCD ATPase subunit